jgi:hypothetical protein
MSLSDLWIEEEGYVCSSSLATRFDAARAHFTPLSVYDASLEDTTSWPADSPADWEGF